MLVPDVGGRLPQNYTRAEDHREYVIPFCQGEGCYWLIEKPCPNALVGRCEAMDQEPVDVGPINGRMCRIPNRTLAASVTGRSNASRL